MRTWNQVIGICALLSLPAGMGRAATVLISASGPGGHHYEVVQQQVTWTQANADADAAGGFLLTIGDSAEQSLAENLLSQSNAPTGAYWFGLRQADHNSIYTHITGVDATYTHWLAGEPNDLTGTETRASILWSDAAAPTFARRGFWNDLPNGLGYPQVAGLYPDLTVQGYVVEFLASGPTYNNGDGDSNFAPGQATPAAAVPLPLGAMGALPVALLAAWAAGHLSKGSPRSHRENR